MRRLKHRSSREAPAAVVFVSIWRKTLINEKEGQIAHLDHSCANSSEDNLAYLCLKHHSLYDSHTSQHRNYTIQEAKRARAHLYAEVDGRKPCEWWLVLDGPFSAFDKARVEALADHLRSLLKDPHLTIKGIRKGSVNLFLESSERAYEEINRMVASGQLNELSGFPVLVVRRSTENEEVRQLESGGYPSTREEVGKQLSQLAKQYLSIRGRLIHFFQRRRMTDPEMSSDEVLFRVLRQLLSGVSARPDLVKHCYDMARLFLLETWRRPTPEVLRGELPAMEESPYERLSHAEMADLLNRCMNSVPAEDRDLWLRYYNEDTHILASELGIPVNALRVRAYRAQRHIIAAGRRLIGKKSRG